MSAENEAVPAVDTGQGVLNVLSVESTFAAPSTTARFTCYGFRYFADVGTQDVPVGAESTRMFRIAVGPELCTPDARDEFEKRRADAVAPHFLGGGAMSENNSMHVVVLIDFKGWSAVGDRPSWWRLIKCFNSIMFAAPRRRACYAVLLGAHNVAFLRCTRKKVNELDLLFQHTEPIELHKAWPHIAWLLNMPIHVAFGYATDLFASLAPPCLMSHCLGCGATASVFAVTTLETTPQLRAAKVFDGNDADLAAHDRDREVACLMLLNAIDAPHIPRLVSDVGGSSTPPFLLMDTVYSPIPAETFPRLGCIAYTLQYAHLVCVHRDVRPANIMLDVDGAPVLGDWGYAAYLGPDAVATGGTLRFASQRVLRQLIYGPATRVAVVEAADDLESLANTAAAMADPAHHSIISQLSDASMLHMAWSEWWGAQTDSWATVLRCARACDYAGLADALDAVVEASR